MHTPVPIPVPKNEKVWWAKNRIYPVIVDLDYDTLYARVGERAYQLLPQPNGDYIVAFKSTDRFIEAGRFNEQRAFRTLTLGAARDIKAIRSAVYNTDYAYIVAVRTPEGLAHAGECVDPSSGVRLYTVKDQDLETRCHKCGEGFE